ncbi:hypothetical protein SLS56_010579 [Neofusicoccum ribis]|uniref:Uncharacterized protein n=1 Tax=Neofusicoccum ribis TaxID=45134 RepID=A0ABR3SE13_9PEZI
MLWKMDVCNLKKQLSALSLADFAAWVHRHYNLAWQKRMAASVDRWIPGHRDCQQLRMAERAMVAWREGEPRAPYPIEEYRRLYERREVHADFWNQQYRDTTVNAEECEAEPGVVYQSVEKEGVHYDGAGTRQEFPGFTESTTSIGGSESRIPSPLDDDLNTEVVENLLDHKKHLVAALCRGARLVAVDQEQFMPFARQKCPINEITEISFTEYDPLFNMPEHLVGNVNDPHYLPTATQSLKFR